MALASIGETSVVQVLVVIVVKAKGPSSVVVESFRVSDEVDELGAFISLAKKGRKSDEKQTNANRALT